MRGLSWMELFSSKVTMGNISLGISLEKGNNLVPIPPAVISALYSPKSAGTGPLAEKGDLMSQFVIGLQRQKCFRLFHISSQQNVSLDCNVNIIQPPDPFHWMRSQQPYRPF